MKKSLKYFIIAIVMVLLTVSFTPVNVLSSDKLELRLAALFGPQSPGYKMSYAMPASMVEKLTHGRTKVTIYPNNTLVAPPDLYRGVQEGITDLTYVWAPLNPGAFPLTDLFSLPGLAANQATSNLVINKLFKKFPSFEKQFSTKVKHISTQVEVRADLHSLKPIRTLSELKGKKIACDTAMAADALSRLGANVTQMAPPDMYLAVQRGVMDGTVQGWGSFSAEHMDEILKNHTLIGICPGTSHWFWNRKTWDKFTQEEKEKLELLSLYFQNALPEANVTMTSDLFKRLSPENGHEIMVWSKKDMEQMNEHYRPIWDKWAEDMEGKGYPGKNILKEALRLIEMYSRL